MREYEHYLTNLSIYFPITSLLQDRNAFSLTTGHFKYPLNTCLETMFVLVQNFYPLIRPIGHLLPEGEGKIFSNPFRILLPQGEGAR